MTDAQEDHDPLGAAPFRRKLLDAGIIDDRYPTSSLVWRPNGVFMLQALAARAREAMTALDFGEHIFPSVIAASEFERINETIQDFSKAVFRLSPALVLRPSGESAVYPMFRLWIRTSRDLPVRIFQIGQSYRAGRSQGLFRQAEASFFVEGHTAHASASEARRQVDVNLRMLGGLLDQFAVFALQTVRPWHTNKPVAETHYGFDVMLPSGQALLVASAYQQGQVFSRAFNVKFVDENGDSNHTFQSEFGFSFRILLASLWLTSDDKGVCLLPSLAPVQAVVVAIGDSPSVREQARRLSEQLATSRVRQLVREIAPRDLGRTRWQLEREGVPLRIEVGELEAGRGEFSLVRRDGVSLVLPGDAAGTLVPEHLAGLEHGLRERARQRCDEGFVRCDSTGSIMEVLQAGRGATLPLCESPSCVDTVQTRVGRGEVLGSRPTASAGACLICATPTGRQAFYARRI